MKTEWNGGKDFEENPLGGKVAELTVGEQVILSDKCTELRVQGIEKVKLQRNINRDCETVRNIDTNRRNIIDYMASRFDLTKLQVIGKILAENKKYNNT